MDAVDLYLDLLKKRLTDFQEKVFSYYSPYTLNLPASLAEELEKYEAGLYTVCKIKHYDPLQRAQGLDWPDRGDTMIGLLRLQNIEDCYRKIEAEEIEGDMVEAGVWKGGASIYMQALNRVLGRSSRQIWVCDSFEGLPASTHPADLKYDFTQYKELSVSLEEVKKNFKKYHMLDDHVHFVKGWFADTLHGLPAEKIALLRMDGDLYASTMDILQNLYHKVVVGGFIIVDDFSIDCCVEAVTDFRKANGIEDEIISIDWTGVYWKKSV